METSAPGNKKAATCDVDDITAKAIGNFGPWQFRITLLMSLLKLPIAWFQLNIIFMAPPQDFWCAKPDSMIAYSDDQWRKMCLPHIEEHPCLIFDPEILSIAPMMDRSLIPMVECKKFVYDQTVFKRTITSEWDLVCSKHWLAHLTQIVMMWGILLGSIIFGIIADKYGRRKPLMVAIVMQCVCSYIASVLPWYWWWLGVWFLLALASGGTGIISFVITMEVVSGKWRTTIPVLYQLPFGFGSAVMAILAYYVRDWRKLEFGLASFSALYILYWFWIPESPRWLLATGRTEKALEVLSVAAKRNGRESDFREMVHLLPQCRGQRGQRKNDPGFTAFFKRKNMRQKTLLLSVNWFFTGLGFFAFSQYLGLIGDNVFMTVAVSGIIYIPGSLACALIIVKLGRKTTIWIFQFITALCYVLILATPRDAFANDWPRLIFAGIGFGGLAGSVPALCLYSGEIFPTLGRNAGVGGVTTFARIAAMIAPAVVSLDDVLPDLPLILLGICTFLQMALIIPLPETKGYPLPDTIDQAEQFTRKLTGEQKANNKSDNGF